MWNFAQRCFAIVLLGLMQLPGSAAKSTTQPSDLTLASKITFEAEGDAESVVSSFVDHINAQRSAGRQPVEVNPTDIKNVDATTGLVSLDLRDVPFFKALDLVGEQTGYWPDRRRGESLRLANDADPPAGLLADGTEELPVQVRLTEVARSSGVRGTYLRDDGGPDPAAVQIQKRSSSLGMMFDFFVEPRLELVGNSITFEITEAIDDGGQSLLRSRTKKANIVRGDHFHFDASMNLENPPEEARRVAVLRGLLEADVVESAEEATLELLGPMRTYVRRVAAAESQAAAQEVVVRPDRGVDFVGGRLELEAIKPWPTHRVGIVGEREPLNGVIAGPYVIEWVLLCLAYETDRPLDDRAFRQLIGGRELRLIGEGEHTFHFGGLRTEVDREGVEGVYRHRAEVKIYSGGRAMLPTSLALSAPESTIRLRVPFEFRDVPLPATSSR